MAVARVGTVFSTLVGTLVGILALMSLSPCAVAQMPGIPRTAAGKPDLGGIWQALNEANWNLEPHVATQGAVETLGAIGAVVPGHRRRGWRKDSLPACSACPSARRTARTGARTDPEAKCFMPGVPRATYLPHPFQIVQSDADIMIVYQFAGAVRTIAMTNHGEAPVDSWMGWSNGRWEGDTLVVEVTGLNANWLDRSGNFATEARRVTERYTMHRCEPYPV